MRASRLLSILLLLQARGRLTAQQLADELEVSIRTVYRDIDSLSEAGIPVYGERGKTGGYALTDGYRTRLTGLTPDEAESLFLAGIPRAASVLGLGEALATGQLKLLATLSPDLRARAERTRERFHLDPLGWFSGDDQPQHLGAIADAVWRQQRVRVRYHSWTNEVSRTLEPLGLVLKGGAWYVVAGVENQVRTYRVSSILDLEPLGDSFRRPEGFQLAEFWQNYAQRFLRNVYRERALVRLSPRGQQLLFLLGPAAVQAAEDNVAAPDADGWVQLTLPIESIEYAAVDLLRLGPDVEVLAPEGLRQRMAETAGALAGLYGRTRGALPQCGGPGYERVQDDI